MGDDKALGLLRNFHQVSHFIAPKTEAVEDQSQQQGREGLALKGEGSLAISLVSSEYRGTLRHREEKGSIMIIKTILRTFYIPVLEMHCLISSSHQPWKDGLSFHSC